MWVEGDTLVNAIFRGVTQDQAVTMLDALRPRSADLFDGFDPASAPVGFGKLGERLGADTKAAGVEARFEYSSVGGAAPPSRSADMEVTTQTDASYPGYFRVWIGGRRGADGAVTEPDAFDVYHLLTVAWPDGRSVMVQSTSSDTATLERVARSVESTTADEARALLQPQYAQLSSLPLVGSAALAAAHVELHSDGEVRALCLTVGAADPVCRTNVQLPPTADVISGSLLLDGKWFVVAAGPNYPPTAGAGAEFVRKQGPQLPAQTATIDNWHIALVAVPDGVDTVQLMIPTSPSQSTGGSFNRPEPAG
jgi:hypothetical protein